MALSFIKKVVKEPKINHTPIDPKKYSKSKEKSESHIALSKKSGTSMPHIPFGFDKYILITMISVIFFLSGLGFWIYVNYFMS